MDTISYTNLRAKLADMMNKVADDRAPLLITRQKGSPAVMMSLADFKEYEETAYLLSTDKNREDLKAALAETETQTDDQT